MGGLGIPHLITRFASLKAAAWCVLSIGLLIRIVPMAPMGYLKQAQLTMGMKVARCGLSGPSSTT